MIIKTNNRAVDPNTVLGQVQVSSDGNAYGANTSGAQVMQAGLSEAQKQIQAYMEDQITMGVIDASNKYQQGLNDLLNNPDTGLLTKEDVNALDVMKQYQEAEEKLRAETLASLPNYRKAKDAFMKIADDTNLTKLGVVMKYQYEKGEEHRATLNTTRLKGIIDNAVEQGTEANAFDMYAKNRAVISSLYGNKLGKENLEQKIKDANTNALSQYIAAITADNSATGFETARTLLEQSSQYVNNAELANIKAAVEGKQQKSDIENLIEEARKLFPGDAEKQKEFIRKHNETTSYASESDGSLFDGNAAVESAGSGDYNAYNESSGAFGKYQFLPSTWEEVSAKTGVDPSDHSPEAQDKNAQYYWNELKNELGGNEEATVVAWNWGVENGKRWLEGKKTGIYNGQEFDFDKPYLGNMAVTERVEKAKAYAASHGGNLVAAGMKMAAEQSGLIGIEMANGKNGCAEFVGKFGSYWSPFLKNESDNEVYYVPTMVQDARNSGINVVDFDASKLQAGDLIVYHTSEGDDGHIVIYDGNGGFYGNSSSSGPNGLTVHGSDYHIEGMEPQRIIKTGGSVKAVKKTRWDSAMMESIDSEIDRRIATDKAKEKERIAAKVEQARNQFNDWQINNPNASDTERRQVLAGIIGDDEELRHSELGTHMINIDKTIKAKADAEVAKASKANVFKINTIKAAVRQGNIRTEADLSEVIQNSGYTFTDSQLNDLFTDFHEFQSGKSFDISNYIDRDALRWTAGTWSNNKQALDVIVGEKFNQYKATHNGSNPSTDEIREMVIAATTEVDTGATARYGWFTDDPLKLSDTEVYRLGYSSYDVIKTDEGVYVRFWKSNGDFDDIYATEIPDLLKRNGIK